MWYAELNYPLTHECLTCNFRANWPHQPWACSLSIRISSGISSLMDLDCPKPLDSQQQLFCEDYTSLLGTSLSLGSWFISVRLTVLTYHPDISQKEGLALGKRGSLHSPSPWPPTQFSSALTGIRSHVGKLFFSLLPSHFQRQAGSSVWWHWSR